MQPHNRNVIIAIIYFTLSILITGWFIEQKFWYFASPSAILLSNAIAISKWGVQVVAALILLKEKKWIFIKRLGAACFASSCTFITIYVTQGFPLTSWEKFKYTMILALITMIVLYYKAVIDTGLSKLWFLGWLLCIAITIISQGLVFK